MAEEEKEEKKSSKLLPIIIGAVGGIVLLLAGLALGFFLFSSPAADPSAEVDEIIEKNSEGEEEIEEDEIILKLNSCKHFLSREVTSLINLKFSPKLVFRIDRSIDEISNIEKVLRKEKVLNDLNKN